VKKSENSVASSENKKPPRQLQDMA